MFTPAIVFDDDTDIEPHERPHVCCQGTDATGVILFIDSQDGADQNWDVREVGSTNDYKDRELEEYGNTMFLVGLNFWDQFEAWIDDTDVKIYLMGWVEDSVGFYSLDIPVTDPSPLNSWETSSLLMESCVVKSAAHAKVRVSIAFPCLRPRFDSKSSNSGEFVGR